MLKLVLLLVFCDLWVWLAIPRSGLCSGPEHHYED